MIDALFIGGPAHGRKMAVSSLKNSVSFHVTSDINMIKKWGKDPKGIEVEYILCGQIEVEGARLRLYRHGHSAGLMMAVANAITVALAEYEP